jgi:hypothetical protein
VQQSIIDFLSGLSISIIQGFSEALKHGEIGDSIEKKECEEKDLNACYFN